MFLGSAVIVCAARPADEGRGELAKRNSPIATTMAAAASITHPKAGFLVVLGSRARVPISTSHRPERPL
jgi:hypothetical protein